MTVRFRVPDLGRASAALLGAVLAGGATACVTRTLDAGSDKLHGLLPVDERNPIVVVNDGYHDNWDGEYALLFANSGTDLAGIVITAAGAWPNIDENLAGWRAMIEAARASGMKNAPDPIASVNPPLVEPADGNVDSTEPEDSAGARFVLDAASRVSLPYRPLVVSVGTALTVVADAYLLDHTLPERVVVVAYLGSGQADGGTMGFPNGDLDPWADAIVAEKFRYIQVSASYDGHSEAPSSLLAQLPNNPFGVWITAKQPSVQGYPIGADQVALLASALPAFVLEADRLSPSLSPDASSPMVPNLVPDPNGSTWLVPTVSPTLGPAAFSRMVLDPKTYGQ